MSTINQPPRLQLGDAPLDGFTGSSTDQVVLLWQTIGSTFGDTFLVEFREPNGVWSTVPGLQSTFAGSQSRTMHEVTIDGLDFDSTYEYRVTHTQGNGSTEVFSANFDTRLAPDDVSEFTFAAYGDAATASNLSAFNQVQSQINANDPNFALLLGDNAYPSGTRDDFDLRFETGTAAQSTLDWIASNIDYATIGNHEANSGGDGYLEGYSNPTHSAGVDGTATSPEAELYYSFDYGMAHFVTFDSNTLNNASELATAMNYVVSDLEASDATWNIVFAHHPVGGAPDKNEGPEDNYWQQVIGQLYNAGADLLLVGHSHTYSWTYPLTGSLNNQAVFVEDLDKTYTQGDGVVQVISGAGGSSLRSGSFSQFDFLAEGYSSTTATPVQYGYANVEVSEDALVVDYVSAANGSVIDSFTIESSNLPPTQTVSFQNGVNGYSGAADTYLREFSPSTNFGNATSINVDGEDGGGDVQGLIRFDDVFGQGSNQIAQNSDVLSASLVLNVSNPGNPVQLHEMLQTWQESNNWNDLGSGIQANGSEASSSAVATTGSVGTGLFSIDVTSSLNAWLDDPASNNGWALLSTGTNGVDFASSETSSGPRLVVTYRETVGGTTTGTPGEDTLLGTSGDDTINALGGNDFVYAYTGDDSIDGGAGNDDLHGVSGQDTLNGGAGLDRIFGGDDADLINGGADNDNLQGQNGDDTINGDTGDDRINGGAGADQASGGTGNDIIVGGSDNDTIDGGSGADRLYGDGEDDVILGGTGTDTLDGGAGNDSLDGGDNFDRLYGRDGDDTLITGEGDGGDIDNIGVGGAGDDLIIGGTGQERLNGETGNDTLNGGGGDDQLNSGTGDDEINGDAGNDRLIAGAGNDTLNGGAENDTLFGGDDDDLLDGGDGDDRIDGQNGSDTATGGAGADDFIWAHGAATDGDADVITDLNFAEDTLIIRSFGGNPTSYIDSAAELYGLGFAGMTVAEIGGDTLITVDEGTTSHTLLLEGITDPFGVIG